jgi:hypothetical protein
VAAIAELVVDAALLYVSLAATDVMMSLRLFKTYFNAGARVGRNTNDTDLSSDVTTQFTPATAPF